MVEVCNFSVLETNIINKGKHFSFCNVEWVELTSLRLWLASPFISAFPTAAEINPSVGSNMMAHNSFHLRDSCRR
jgi:hypothetical protein